MKRKRITQLLPGLLPLRLKQQKLCYYAKMRLDANRYCEKTEAPYPYTLASDQSLLINHNTGADIAYQYNKVHNLRLASQTVSGVVIYPGETFSLWWLVRHADEREKYKDGLCVHNGTLTHVYGGGLCQLSNMLFWLFLHTPVTIVERHMHKVKEFPNPSPDDPIGVDATILEGWLDLRARNDTDMPIQIELSMDEEYYRGKILVPRKPQAYYDVVNENLTYFAKDGRVYESVDVIRRTLSPDGEPITREKLYTNVCEVGYDVPAARVSRGATPSRAIAYENPAGFS